MQAMVSTPDPNNAGASTLQSIKAMQISHTEGNNSKNQKADDYSIEYQKMAGPARQPSQHQ